MGKRSNGTRSQSPAMMAQTRTMSMSSIGGVTKQKISVVPNLMTSNSVEEMLKQTLKTELLKK